MEAGTFHYALVYALINVGSTTCHLGGYPRLIAERYPFSVPPQIHHETGPPWGQRTRAVTLRPGGTGGLLIGWVGDWLASGDVTARRIRYCMRQTTQLFRVVLPGTTQPLPEPARPISLGLCPTRVKGGGYLGRDVYLSPILPTPKPPRIQ